MNDVSRANREWKDEARQRREVQERARNLPSRFQGGRPSPRRHVVIIGGNTLIADPGVGINYADEIIDEVPDDYDPNVDDTFIDGIGRATLYVDGVPQDDKVLVVNDQRGLFTAAFIVFDGAVVGEPVRIPVAGGGSIEAYVPA